MCDPLARLLYSGEDEAEALECLSRAVDRLNSELKATERGESHKSPHGRALWNTTALGFGILGTA